MTQLVFFLEEPSAREMLKGLLPRILPDDLNIVYVVFEGRQDLEKRLLKKLRAWQMPDARFIVICDQDASDCIQLKNKLLAIGQTANRNILVRIACHELESWYLGDLQAVETALKLSRPGLANLQNKAKYRTPDTIEHPSAELQKLSKRTYQKIAGSRVIGVHLRTEGNLSHSYTVFLQGVLSMANE